MSVLLNSQDTAYNVTCKYGVTIIIVAALSHSCENLVTTAMTEQVQNALTAAVVRGIIGAVVVLVIVSIVTPLVVVTCILKRNVSRSQR